MVNRSRLQGPCRSDTVPGTPGTAILGRDVARSGEHGLVRRLIARTEWAGVITRITTRWKECANEEHRIGVDRQRRVVGGPRCGSTDPSADTATAAATDAADTTANYSAANHPAADHPASVADGSTAAAAGRGRAEAGGRRVDGLPRAGLGANGVHHRERE